MVINLLKNRQLYICQKISLKELKKKKPDAFKVLNTICYLFVRNMYKNDLPDEIRQLGFEKLLENVLKSVEKGELKIVMEGDHFNLVPEEPNEN